MGLKSPVMPAYCTTSPSVIVLAKDASAPILMSEYASSITICAPQYAACSLAFPGRQYLSPQRVSRDNHTLHLGGSFVNLGDLGVTISPLHWIGLRETIPPVNLDRLACHPGGSLRGEQLRHRRPSAVNAASVSPGPTPASSSARGILRSHTLRLTSSMVNSSLSAHSAKL